MIKSKRWQLLYSENALLKTYNEQGVIQAGDTIKLLPGYHGNVNIISYTNDDFITIDGGRDANVKLGSLYFLASSKWRIKGLSISPYHIPKYNPSSTDKIDTIVKITSNLYHGPSSEIEMFQNDIFTLDDISAWSAEQWNALSSSGISLNASNSRLSGNTVRNINFGMTINSNNVDVQYNKVINFAGDAIRGLGDFGLFEYNLIANAFKINDNHDDGFQSWSRNGQPVNNITLRGNRFYYDYNHPNQNLISSYQGVGCFDGFYNNFRWTIYKFTQNSLYYGNIRILNYSVIVTEYELGLIIS